MPKSKAATERNDKPLTSSELKTELDGIEIPKPYILTPSGVYRSKAGEDGENTNALLFPMPLFVAKIYNNIDTATEKVEIRYYYHGEWRSVIVDRNVISSTTNIVKLSDKGIPVDSTNAKQAVGYLNKAITSCGGTIPYERSRTALGWVGNKFVPFTDDVTFDGEGLFRTVFKRIETKGTVTEWAEFIEPLIAESLPLRMMVAASFASPLIERVGENPFVLHLFGKTGLAKTVALMVAMSIWGDPTLGGLVRTLNMTANSMLSTAAFLNNIPFAGDELQTIKNRFEGYDKLIMCITEGIDRGRMSYDKLNDIKTWKCAFITTGEDPCVLPNSGGGVKNRVIQIECNSPIIGTRLTGNKVANFVKSHYGVAARDYIEAVAERDVKTEYETIYTDIIDRGTDTTNKQAGAMSMLLLADRIATELFFPNLTALEFDDVKQFLFTEAEVDIAERAYQFICDKISENYNMFDKDTSKTVWGKLDTTNGYCLMNKTVLEKLLRENMFDFDAVKNSWAEHDYIAKQNGRFKWSARINDVMTTCVKIFLPSEEPTTPPKVEQKHTEPPQCDKSQNDTEESAPPLTEAEQIDMYGFLF